MLEREELDAVVLLTPPAVRDEVIYPAMERGRHLLIEKPFAVAGPKAVEYVAVAEAAGVHLAVSQNFRLFPEMQWPASRLAAPDTGTPGYIGALSFQNRPQQPGMWRAREAKPEMTILSIHLIDRIQWLAPGAPTFVSAITRCNAASGLPGEQFTSLSVQFDDGMVADMVSSWMSTRLPHNDMRVDTGSAGVSRTHPMSGEATGTAHFAWASGIFTVPGPHGADRCRQQRNVLPSAPPPRPGTLRPAPGRGTAFRFCRGRRPAGRSGGFY